jgi:hypothetical protein
VSIDIQALAVAPREGIRYGQAENAAGRKTGCFGETPISVRYQMKKLQVPAVPFWNQAGERFAAAVKSDNYGECCRPLHKATMRLDFRSANGLVVACFILSTLLCTTASAQESTSTEFWPSLEARVQLLPNLRAGVLGGLEQGEGVSYQQWYAGFGFGYQVKSILRAHLTNIDADKEHFLVFAAGYEHLRTTQPGKTKNEDRIAAEATGHYRPFGSLLLEERNRVEFRWVKQRYSTRYRNQVTVERDFLVHHFQITPYASAEVFYDGDKHSWDEEYYAAGLRVPYKRHLLVDAYYLRQECTSCSPGDANVAGLTLQVFFKNKK